MKHLLAYLGLFLLLMLAGCARHPEITNEALIRMNPEGSEMLSFVFEQPVPPGVRRDLDALNKSLAAYTAKFREIDDCDVQVRCSPNGRAVALTKVSGTPWRRSDSETWIWKDWRNADEVIRLSPTTTISFLSNEVLRAEHLTDVRRPDEPIDLMGWDSESLYFGDARWAATAPDGRVRVGDLNRPHPLYESKPVHIDAEARRAILRQGDSILVVECRDDFVRSYHLAGGPPIASRAGVFGFGSWTGDHQFVLSCNDREELVSVTPEGYFDKAKPLTWLGGWLDERLAGFSPHGDCALTMRDGLLPGLETMRLRDLRRDHTITLPMRSHAGYYGWVAGWLSWDENESPMQ